MKHFNDQYHTAHEVSFKGRVPNPRFKDWSFGAGPAVHLSKRMNHFHLLSLLQHNSTNFCQIMCLSEYDANRIKSKGLLI